jgi:two-component system, OmpR family, response regulator PrrA
MGSASGFPRVMVVADDADVLSALERGLRVCGFDTYGARSAAEALSIMKEARQEAVVVDIGWPALRGICTIEALRAMDGIVPVCVLTDRSAIDVRVPGLAVGADDYLFKPFALSELDTRVRALLRRPVSAISSSSETITVGPLVVEIRQRRACVNGVEIALTQREFDLLAVLAAHGTKALSRAQLLKLVWGNGPFAADTHVVDAFVENLRHKLDAAGAPRLLHTVPGAGVVLRVQQ